ncbi:hypothetical protein DFQ26_000207 [Actinomortierella ambigua]|nr:hypothetical protein DFQ26_000207 [Actinomortierella ambigua]
MSGGGDVEMTDADEQQQQQQQQQPAHTTTHTRTSISRGMAGPSFVRHGSHSHDEDDEEHDELDEDDSPPSHSKNISGETAAAVAPQIEGGRGLGNSNNDTEGDNDEGDDDDYDEEVSFLQHDPLFVLHASLWSDDGSQVRSMIATPGQQDPPKLTRILMGSIVVSPILLNNPQGEPGWYFSFPDLSIRTEGVYTLKFSLLRFGSFNFNVEDGGKHASEVIDEATSQPFTVFSAKKFPGMTESTELSKTFAKQGLKIPIRNDLRVRKADRD